MRGSPRVPGAQGARMGNSIVVSQQRQQQNQTMPQPQAQQVMYVAQPFMPLNFGKFPANYTGHTVRTSQPPQLYEFSFYAFQSLTICLFFFFFFLEMRRVDNTTTIKVISYQFSCQRNRNSKGLTRIRNILIH